MKIWIVLLRGINVGGKNLLPMFELRQLLEELGCESVKTYIQSGNCVFKSRETSAIVISEIIAKGICKKFELNPTIIVLSAIQLRDAINNCPYDGLNVEPNKIHLFFLSKSPVSADIDALHHLKHSTEEFKLTKNVFYLLAPDGVSRSKLAAKAEAKIGVPATARNYRTVKKLADLVNKI